jgi:hypothetical protein
MLFETARAASFAPRTRTNSSENFVGGAECFAGNKNHLRRDYTREAPTGLLWISLTRD